MTNLVIISGLSGSGKSTAVNVLEDLGYYCVDNIPPTLLPPFIELCENSDKDINKVALVIDIRERVSFDSAPTVIEEFKKKGYPVDMIFLESSDQTLIKGENTLFQMMEILLREYLKKGRCLKS